MTDIVLTKEYMVFLDHLKQRVATSRLHAARSVNTELILLYHHIGSEILKRQKENGWGAKVIDRLSRDLRAIFPEMKGFSTRNLKYMRLFAESYTDVEFVQQVAAQLPWFHTVVLLDKIKDPEERLFYFHKAIEHGWSRNVMVHQLELGLHKRQGKAITNFSDKLPAPHSELAHQVLKDPYIFDFLSIGNEAHEREIENALTQHIQKFLLELGSGFAFVGNQVPIQVGEEEFFIDMLFYHLELRCFVVIELKAGKFKPADIGQLNFYLTAVNNQIKKVVDNPTIGVLLCKEKDKIVAEYALKEITQPIGLAEYHLTDSLPENLKTVLPTIEELEEELSKNIPNILDDNGETT